MLNFIQTPITDLTVIQRKPMYDSRGFFSRFFCAETLNEIGLNQQIQQINHTHTVLRGTVRGLHFQYPPHVETKIVSCLRGEVFDVAVDLRKNSPTFLHWHAEVLSAENHRSLFIPEGFAHGFQTLSNDCEMLYLHTAAYAKHSEDGLNIHDPRLAIDWPLEITEMSERDQSHPLIYEAFEGITL